METAALNSFIEVAVTFAEKSSSWRSQNRLLICLFVCFQLIALFFFLYLVYPSSQSATYTLTYYLLSC